MYYDIEPYELPPRGAKSRRFVPVCQFGLDGKFIAWYPSILAAAKSLGRFGDKTNTGISWACRVKRKAFGFQWRHAADCAIKKPVKPVNLAKAKLDMYRKDLYGEVVAR